jgi:hypothetical protein
MSSNFDRNCSVESIASGTRSAYCRTASIRAVHCMRCADISAPLHALRCAALRCAALRCHQFRFG